MKEFFSAGTAFQIIFRFICYDGKKKKGAKKVEKNQFVYERLMPGCCMPAGDDSTE